MKFDDLFEYVGEMGTYQWMMFLMLSMISVFGVEAISVNFVSAYMDHWCRVDALESYPHEHQKYVAIPQDSDGVYSTCDRFDFDFASFTPEEIRRWNRSTMVTNNTRIISCNQWVYDRGEFVATSVSQFDLVCTRQDLVPLISTLFMVGILVGSFVSGPISDKFGRRPVILGLLFIKIAAALMGAFANNFIVFAIARTFLGFGVFSAYLVAFVLVMELVGPTYRSFFNVGFSLAYGAGILLISGMSHAIREAKWLQVAYVVPVGILVIFWWLIPESPRWLVTHGRHEEANKIIRHMAAVNQCNLPADFDTMKIEEDVPVEEKSFIHIFKSKNIRNRSFVIDLYWFTVNLIYYALSFNIGYLSGSVFVNTVISAAVEIPSNVLCMFLCNWKVTGRRLTCCLAMVLGGISSFIRIGLILKGLEMADTGFSFVGRAFVTVGFSGIYVYAAEVFPTEVRNGGLAIAAVFAQISGAVSPYVGGPLTRVWAPLPALIFGVLSLASGMAVLALPETLGAQMFETIEEAEKFSGKAKSGSGDGTMDMSVGGTYDHSSEPSSLRKPQLNDVISSKDDFATNGMDKEDCPTGYTNPGADVVDEGSIRL